MIPNSSHEDHFDALSVSRWETEGGSCRSDGSADPVPTSQQSGSKVFSILNRKAAILKKAVYPTLADHQRSEIDWDYNDLYVFVEEWFVRNSDEFRLGLPRVPLRLDPRMRRNCAGSFLAGHNEFGLVYEIAVAVPPPTELHSVDLGDLIGTILHEQLHLLQELTGLPGRNNYHNVQFRATAERFGLLIDGRGHQSYSTDSLFIDLLKKHGVELPRIVQMQNASGIELLAAGKGPKRPSKSTLRKWTCGCQNAWVGTREFTAECTSCKRMFHQDS